MILDLGCGLNKQFDAIGVDNVLLDGVDVVHDLNCFPYPFKTNTINDIYLNDVLEHLDDVIDVMRECYRILKSNGILHIRVVHWSHRYSYSDPQHKHYFSEIYWEFFTGKRRPYYMDFQFKDLKLEYIFDQKAIRKYGNDENILLEKSYFKNNIIQGMKIELIK